MSLGRDARRRGAGATGRARAASWTIASTTRSSSLGSGSTQVAHDPSDSRTLIERGAFLRT